MPTLLTFFIINPIVWISILLVGMTLFRQNLSGMAQSIIITVITVSTMKPVLQFVRWESVVSTVEPLILILCFRYLLQYTWTYAVIIVSMTCSIAGMNEFIIIYTHFLFDINSEFSLSSYIVLSNISIAMLLKHFRIGFTFIQRSGRNQRIDFLTTLIFILSMLNTAVHGSFTLSSVPIQYVYLILFVFLIVLLRLNYYKELKEA